MSMIWKFLCICTIALLSCSKGERKTAELWSIEKQSNIPIEVVRSNVEGQNLNINIDQLKIRDFQIFGNFALVQDNGNIDRHLFHLLELNSLKFVSNFIIKGEGLNEVLNPELVKLIDFNIDKKYVRYADFAKRSIIVYNFESKEYNVELDFSNLSMPQEFVLVDTSFIYSDLDEEYSLKKINKALEILESSKIDNYLSLNDKTLWDRVYNFREIVYIENTIVGVNSHNNCVSYFDLNLNPTFRLCYGLNENIENGKYDFSKSYHHSLRSTTNGNLTVFDNISSMERITEKIISNINSQIHLFNVKNNKLIILETDEFVSLCDYWNDANALICVNENNENQPFVTFDFPQEIDK